MSTLEWDKHPGAGMYHVPPPTLDHLEPKIRSAPLQETLDNENPIRIAILYEEKRQISIWVSDKDDQIRMKLNNNYDDVILPLLTDNTSIPSSDYVIEHRRVFCRLSSGSKQMIIIFTKPHKIASNDTHDIVQTVLPLFKSVLDQFANMADTSRIQPLFEECCLSAFEPLIANPMAKVDHPSWDDLITSQVTDIQLLQDLRSRTEYRRRDYDEDGAIKNDQERRCTIL